MTEDLQDIKDHVLFATLAEGEEARNAAFQEIYRRYARQLYVYCLKVMPEAAKAEDIFQETFLRVLRAGRERREMTNLPAYVMRIARNLCLEQKRFEQKKFVDLEEIDLSRFDTMSDENELRNLIDMTLDTLSAEQREAFVLQTFNGMSYSQIAEVTDVPVSTVRNRVVRAKQRVREIVSRYFLEDPK
ncbi:MAG TPA: RNA polymerase sigma factor [Candidatus Kapabacteria bacterium]|nr:RNA polymerase sigma factor [Candidatus Kapabacteria bacterium]